MQEIAAKIGCRNRTNARSHVGIDFAIYVFMPGTRNKTIDAQQRDILRSHRGRAMAMASAMKLICLLPGSSSFVVFAVYPLWIEPAALTIAIKEALGPSALVGGFAANADALLLIGGIVMSSVCWFYAERWQRDDARREPATAPAATLGAVKRRT
jgi:hypothetical protein